LLFNNIFEKTKFNCQEFSYIKASITFVTYFELREIVAYFNVFRNPSNPIVKQ